MAELTVNESLVRPHDCYANALRFATANQHMPWLVVHALISNRVQGVVTSDLAHAWCEIELPDGWYVYEPGTRDLVPRDIHYGLAKARHICRYTLIEATSKAIMTEEAGPWDHVLLRHTQHVHTTKFKPRRRK